jgi:RNA polymerase sigma-70 factor (ECF subfamily)
VQDEQGLVRGAQEGDKDAFAQLYEAYFDKIYRYIVIKISNKAEAEDMTQQVFLKAYQSIRSFKWKGAPFSAWLFRIAHNQIVDFYRKKSKRPTVRLEESTVVSSDNPLRTVENRFDIERLRVAALQLTSSQQEVISLRFAGGLAITEVARTMGKSEGAIKALQHSAVVALRKVLLVGEESEER